VNGAVGEEIISDVDAYHLSFFINQEWNTSVVSYNVVGQINGETPSKVALIGCLYDAMLCQGSTDSGVGVGILLAVGRYMKDHNIVPKYTLKFVAFGGEEYGLVGAIHYEVTHRNENIVEVIDMNQYAYIQNSPSSIMNIATNGPIRKYVFETLVEKTNYESRTETPTNTFLNLLGSLSDNMPFAAASKILNPYTPIRPFLRYVMPLKDTSWYRHHRTGMNYEEGDSLKYIDWNDAYTTGELIWNTTRFLVVPQNCWFQSIGPPQLLDSPDTVDINHDPDYVNVTYTIRTSMPEDHVTVKAYLRPKLSLLHPFYPIRFRYHAEKTYTITSSSAITDTISIHLAQNAPEYEYNLDIYLMDSYGEIIYDTLDGIGLEIIEDIDEQFDTHIMDRLENIQYIFQENFGINLHETLHERRIYRNILLDIIGRYLLADDAQSYGPLSLTPPNDPPATPDAPEGPTTLKRFMIGLFNASTTDPQADQIYYQWNFRANKDIPYYTPWILGGPYESGETCQKPHAYIFPGTYEVTVRAKDPFSLGDSISEWSDSMTVTVTRWSDCLCLTHTNQTECEATEGCYWHPFFNKCLSWPPLSQQEFSNTILCTAPTTILANQTTQMLGYNTQEMIAQQQLQTQEQQTRGEEEFTWNWTFGDGTNSSEKSPTHTYNHTGTYQINLTIWDEDNIPYNFTKHIQVLHLIADFTASPYGGHINETIQFTDTSTHEYNITDWNWDFGDDNQSTDQNPTHTYTINGSYNITLNITDNHGNYNQITKTIYIEGQPPILGDIDATPTLAKCGTPIHIYADTLDNQSMIHKVNITMTYPNKQIQNYTMNQTEINCYYDFEYLFTDTWTPGQYFFNVTAHDHAGNTNTSPTFMFHIGLINYTVEYPENHSIINDLNPTLTTHVITLENNSHTLNISFMNQYPSFTSEHQINTTDIDNTKAIDVADFDNDGDIDIVHADTEKIAWWENINDTFQEHILEQSSADYRDVHAIDMDQDGDSDLISCSQDDWDPGEIMYWNNSGDGTFSSHIINNTFTTRAVHPADIDSDGEIDIASIIYEGIHWWRNNGNGTFTQHYLPIYTNGFRWLQDINTADLDNDGDQDIIIVQNSAINSVGWYENFDSGSGFVFHNISIELNETWKVYTVDLDQDNDSDILTAHGSLGLIHWLKNKGDKTFILDDGIEGDVSSMSGIQPGDIDADGDIDIAGAYTDKIEDIEYYRIAWYRNEGDGTFSKIAYETDMINPCCVRIVDMDNDIDQDLVVAGDDEIMWFENVQTFGEAMGVSSWSDACYDLQGLEYDTSYSWRAVALYNGSLEISPLWCFNTSNISISMITDEPDIVGYGFPVTITANITTQYGNITDAMVNITYPDQATTDSITLNQISGSWYNVTFSDTWQLGEYTYTVYVVTDADTSAVSWPYTFQVSAQTNMTIATLKDTYRDDEDINLTDPPNNPAEDQTIALIDQGSTWNRYYLGKDVYRLESYNDLINYQDDCHQWHPVNTSNLTLNTDGSWSITSLPYRFKILPNREGYIVYLNHDSDEKRIMFGMPQGLTDQHGIPFYQTIPTINRTGGYIQWDFTDYSIKIQLLNSKLLFFYTMKNSCASPWINMTITPIGMRWEDVPIFNQITDADETIRVPETTYNQTTHQYSISIDTRGLTYPITLDPSLDFYSLTQDAYMEKTSASYWTAHNATTTTVTNNSLFYIGQRYYSSTYYVDRGYVFFDLLDIPAEANIMNATLRLTTYMDNSATDFNITIQNGQPLSPHNPPIGEDYYHMNYSGDGGKQTTVGLTAPSGIMDIPLNETGISWLNLNSTNITKLCLRSSRDITGLVPTTNERVRFLTGSGQGPCLIINYTFNTSTTVNSISPYTHYTPSLVTLSAQGNSSLENVTVYYRHSTDNNSWNRTYENYTTGADDYWQYLGFPWIPMNGYEYQTFRVGAESDNNTFLLRSMSFLLNKSGSGTGLCFSLIRDSDQADVYESDFYPADDIPDGEPDWCTIPASGCVLEKGVTYRIMWTPLMGTNSDYINIWRDNTSATYSGGCRWNTQSGAYVDDDYLFSMQGDWIMWDNTSNPDTVSPWNWVFNTPYGPGYYEFSSQGAREDCFESLPLDQPDACILYCTRPQSKIVNTGTTDILGYLLMQVHYYNETSDTWMVADDTVNETTSTRINASTQLGLDTIFNEIVVNTSDFTSFGDGIYRVYAAFRDPDGNILINNDESLMEASFQFTINFE